MERNPVLSHDAASERFHISYTLIPMDKGVQTNDDQPLQQNRFIILRVSLKPMKESFT